MYRLLMILLAFSATAIAGEIDQAGALEALEALKRPDTLLIDVRTAEEYAEGAIPGSVRIGSEELRARIAAVAPDKDQPVVLYCRSGRRSSAAQDLLQQLGYRQVINGGGYEQLREAIQDQ
ncbi:rhodanese-like domain-containing protein [Stutzerimonas nitrititolerans]|uniref:rhodanese-like domain-containing protein n=1 Tax=Stutzerimonas nitrititolerans TaxID=2482751 RepID=UPI0028AA6EEF|nr:rhodanese-like domain-containing protein [Stutzerimonas nitrititolerans]